MLLNKKVPVAYIINKVKFEFIFVLIISICVLFLTDIFQDILPEMPLTVPAFIGTAISILLSFKLNQSYDRWWEARKVWGSIVNDSRSFVIQLQMLAAKGNETAIRTIAYRQIAWCYCLGQSLRGLNPLDNLEGLLSAEDLAAMKLHNNKSLALLQMHGRDIKELKENNQLDIFSQVQLDSTLVRLCEAQGKAERIKSTVFPVTYRLFLHYIIYLFVITLSISLEDVAGYFEIPLLMVLSMAFFLLEKSATHMQDPFENRPTDTAMTAIARTIEINIRQLLKETDVPAPHQPEVFYLS
ncbi:bestrophin family protein [Telluribacter sp.]|jgi:putative membrane protein|uniref:bestrophin family protein n=1 Tax=Telluribacter sp. TaxID=1978767 RepID=UPI002E119387|nr:bestrophin family ion channel [Telluribacter sp.]